MAIGIPTVTKRQVLPDASPLPTSNLQGSSGGIVIGRALQATGAEIARAVEPLVAVQEEIQRQKDATDYDKALLDYDTKAQALLNSEGGLYQRQGKAAIDQGVAVSKRLSALKAEILNNQSLSPKARQAVTDSLARRELSYTDQVSSYVNRQRMVHEEEVSAARKNEALDHALANFRNRDAVQEALTSLYVQTDFDAQRNGWDETITESKRQEATSTLFVGVIDRYLAVGDVGGAQAFYKQNKRGIDGRQYSEIERVFERHRKEAVAALADDVRDAVGILSMGKLPVGLDRLQRAVKGSKYEKVLNEAMADRAFLEDFAHKSLTDQQAELQRLNLQQQFTVDEARRFDGMARAHATIVKRLEAGDGLALAQELGVIDSPANLDLTDTSTLKARRRQAELASEHFGVTIGPLTGGEISSLTTQLETAPADQAAAMLDALHSGFGDMATEIAGQLSKGQRPEYGSAMLLAGEPNGRQQAIDIILGGRQRRELGGDLELTAEGKRPVIADVLGNMFEGLEGEPLNEFIAAADALYAARRAPLGDLTFDAGTYEQAFREAIGGVVEFNGRKVIPPTSTMDDGEFKSLVRSLTDAEMVRYSVSGGIPFAGEQPFFVQLFQPGAFGLTSGTAQLVSVGPGIYRVSIPGLGFLQDGATGGPYEIDLKAALDGRKGR